MLKILFVPIIILLAIYILFKPKKNTNQTNTQLTQPTGTRPVVFIIIDSLMDKPMQEMIRQGKAPPSPASISP